MNGFGIFIFIFFVLLAIAIHEAGHFATAKWFKIKVDRFFIGFGPKLWSIKRGETEYGVSAFPLGGYVRIAGMNPLEEIPPEERHRTFRAKPAWQRAIVLAAGSFTHFVVALIILASMLAISGEPDFDRPTLTLGTVGSTAAGEGPAPAEVAGLRPGDRIVSIGGQRVSEWRQVQEAIRSREPGQSIDIVVDRDGRRATLTATLGKTVRDGATIPFLGVSPEFAKVERGVFSAIGAAAVDVGVGMKDSLIAFKNIFSPSTLGRLFKVATGTEERRPEDPATIVGIGKTSGDLARRGDFTGLFLLVAGFNVFVGVANLLPLPPLDGGHLAVLAWEKITRRDVDMRKLLPVTAMVLTIFGMLFLLLLYTDIVNPLPSIPG